MNCKAVSFRLLPILKYLRKYNTHDALSDFIAGVTVGLTVLPQALAYATLAGLEPQYGLYSAIVGGIVYALFGSVREVTIGPTALLALMTSKYTGFGLNSGVTYAIFLCFMSGIVELLMALLKLGALVDFISLPVTVGFTSATAVIIGTSQLKGLLGLRGGSGASFLSTIYSVATSLHKIRYPDLLLGLSCICALLGLRMLKQLKLEHGAWKPRTRRCLLKLCWFISTGRNALIVLITSVLAYARCANREQCDFVLTGTVKSGLPPLELPRFSTAVEAPNGGDGAITQNFGDMLGQLGSSLLVLPIVAVLGNVAISKAFGGTQLSATRELLALSLSNILGSCCSSMPVTGSFSRSAVNHASGVRTPVGGIYTSVLVLLALSFLAPYFQYIPKAALSAVIICAVIFMCEFEVVRPLWRVSRRELLPGTITFVVSLLVGVEYGLLLGVSADVVYLVYCTSHPLITAERTLTLNNRVNFILTKPHSNSLLFPAVERVREKMFKALKEYGTWPIVLDCSDVHVIDFTAARALSALEKELRDLRIPFFLLRISAQVRAVLKESDYTRAIQVLNEASELERLMVDSPDYESFLEASVPLVEAQIVIDANGKSK